MSVEGHFVTVRASAAHHPKIDDLAETLGITFNEALGIAVQLWLAAMQFAPDSGDFQGSSIKGRPKTLAKQVGWEGDPIALIEAFRKAGLLDGWVIHEWEKHQAHFVAKRFAAADAGKRSGEARRRKKGDSEQENRPNDSEQFSEQFSEQLTNKREREREREKERKRDARARDAARRDPAPAGLAQGPASAGSESAAEVISRVGVAFTSEDAARARELRERLAAMSTTKGKHV